MARLTGTLLFLISTITIASLLYEHAAYFPNDDFKSDHRKSW